MNVVTCTECFSFPSLNSSFQVFFFHFYFVGDAHLIGTDFVRVCFVSAVIMPDIKVMCLSDLAELK